MDIPQRVRLTEAVAEHPAGLTGTLVDVGDNHVIIELDDGRLLKVPCPYFPQLPYEAAQRSSGASPAAAARGGEG